MKQPSLKNLPRFLPVAFAFACCISLVPAIALADEGSADIPTTQELEAETLEEPAGQNEIELSNEPESVEGTTVISELEIQSEPDETLASSSIQNQLETEPEALAVQSSEQLSTQATSQSPVIANGIYTIISSTGSSKSLDVPGGSGSSGIGLQIYSQNATPAQRWSVRFLGNELYEIVNVGSGKALDVSGARAANGAVVQQYDRNSTNAQKWKIVSAGSGLYKLVSALPDNYVLDVSGGSSANGAKVQLWSDNNTDAQRWSFVSANVIDSGFYVVKNSGSKKVLDIASGSLANSANVQQYSANDTQAQTFHIAYSSSDGYYTITDLGSGKVLDVASGSSANGANVQQYTPNGTRAQKWAAAKNSDGSFTFRSSISGLALDVSGASDKDSANVQVYTSNGTNAQKWSLTKVSNWLPEGSYSIIATNNTNNVVDISGGSTSNGANAQIYASNSTNAQRFYLRSMGGGYYTLQNPASGKYLNIASSTSGANIALGTVQQQFKPVFSAGGITFQLKNDSSLVLDIASGSTKNGANLQLYKSNGTTAQKFVVRGTDMFAEGSYSIRYAANSDFVIDVPSASSSNGLQLHLYESNGTAAQRFNFKRIANNTYLITASCSGKALQAVETTSGVFQLQQCTSTGSSNQQWTVLLDQDGSIQLAPKSKSGYRIDLNGNTVSNTTPISVYTSNGTAAQKWKLVSAKESTTYDALGLTLRRMAELQKSDGCNSSLTVNQLIDLLNPDNLDKSQFLDLRTTTGVTADQLNAFITSTSTGQSGVLKGLGSAFVSASKQYGVNEVYLLAHAILESGWGTSTLAKGYYYSGGTIDGTYYPAGTYYNFYGIGAYDSSPLSGGRKLAIINGWNSPEKAVTGAAKWIANNYIYASSYAQPTLYAMKWDYKRTNATGERGWHQYATSTSWPASIAQLINQCYSRIGGNPNQVYVIPKYQ